MYHTAYNIQHRSLTLNLCSMDFVYLAQFQKVWVFGPVLYVRLELGMEDLGSCIGMGSPAPAHTGNVCVELAGQSTTGASFQE